MARTKNALKQALARQGFQVKTYARGDQSNLWSISGHGTAKNNISQSEAEKFLDDYLKKKHGK